MRSRTRRTTATLAAAALAATGLFLVPTAAQAHGSNHSPTVLTKDVVGPFQLAVNQQRIFVTDGFTGTLSQVTHGSLKTVAQAPGVAGVDFTRNGKTMAFAWSNDDHSQAGLTIRTRGKADVVGDIATYEATQNPDGGATYGIVAGGNPCAEAILGQLTGGPATYPGIIDSHPYSVALKGNSWLVADAGANAILAVDGKGKVSTFAVLPPQRTTITAEMVQGLADETGQDAKDLACLEGVTYAFEPVPTDVEVDQHGTVWVTTLPGGPESAALGARGAVHKITSNGTITRVAGDFLGASNLAITPDGTVYVAELFAGTITELRGTQRSTFAELPGVVALEVHGGTLYAATMADVDFETGAVNAPGTVVAFRR